MKRKDTEVIIFNDDDLSLEICIDSSSETIWLSQAEIATLFEATSDNIGLHIKNIIDDGELDGVSTTEDFSVVETEGNRRVKRNILHYNLDMIISVGYRVKSARATRFRKWATAVLKEYAIKGYAINEPKIDHDKYLQLLNILNRTSHQIELKEILDILEQYTLGVQLLDDYDYQRIQKPKGVHSTYWLEYSLINEMKPNHESNVLGVERE